jgi:Fur family transcriptional regulator, ferric uptake regulator
VSVSGAGRSAPVDRHLSARGDDLLHFSGTGSPATRLPRCGTKCATRLHVPPCVDRIRGLAALAITERARSALRATGERVTPTRLRVYVALLDSARALSHHELEAALGTGAPIDRVTLYRVLEWLVEQGLAHRVAGIDRVWRFSIARESHARHAHFQCNGCGKVICLGEALTSRVPLPRGFRSEAVELTVKGRCAECG